MKTVYCFFFTLSLILCQINAQTPTRWRGPEGTGTYNETGLMDNWPETGPEIIWSTDGFGQGFSSPAFANGKIYLSGMIDNKGYIFILSEQGNIERKINYGSEFYESFPGTRSTPTIVGDLLYILSGMGRLICIDLETGTDKWQKNLFSDFDGENIRWGVTEMVIVDGDKVYVTPGGKSNNIVALNRFTGDLIWSCSGMGELSAYCTPAIADVDGRKLLVTHTASHILGIDRETGGLLWNFEQPNKWSVHANAPLYADGQFLCTSGYGHGSVMLKPVNGGSDVEKVWFNEQLDDRMGGMVKIGDKIYGSGDKNRSWKCMDWNSGEVLYETTEIGKGVAIAADGKVFCYSERGELALLIPGKEAFTIAGKTTVTLGTEQHWAHPVIRNGILYLRHGDTLIAYKIK